MMTEDEKKLISEALAAKDGYAYSLEVPMLTRIWSYWRRPKAWRRAYWEKFWFFGDAETATRLADRDHT